MSYIIPDGSVIQLPTEPEWSEIGEIPAASFDAALERRYSVRHFAPAAISPAFLKTKVLAHLAEVQRQVDGVRFVCAINAGEGEQNIWRMNDSGHLVDPYTPENWVDLFLQEEFVTAPFVAVAVVEADCEWRRLEHQVVAATSALSRVWTNARVNADGIEGSIFAGVLAGWLRSTGRISRHETTGVALALGYPAYHQVEAK